MIILLAVSYINKTQTETRTLERPQTHSNAERWNDNELVKSQQVARMECNGIRGICKLRCYSRIPQAPCGLVSLQDNDILPS